MPKVASSGASGAATAPALRRNQACKQCRKRKLKCDAQKPHCSTCVKQWNAQIAVPPPIGFSHPSEPLCNYDHMEGLSLLPAEKLANPDDRVKLLEKQISDLQSQLVNAQRESESLGLPIKPTSQGASPHPPTLAHQSSSNTSSTTQPSLSPQLSVPKPSIESDITPIPHNASSFQNQQLTAPGFGQVGSRPSSRNNSTHHHAHTLSTSLSISNVGAGSSGISAATSSTNVNNSTGRLPGNVDMDIDAELRLNGTVVDDFGFYPDAMDGQYGGGRQPPTAASPYDLIYSGWNQDLPEPRLLYHLVNLYFTRDACASRILHRPSFLLAMNLPPTHPDFPHPALLHAICASASRWTMRLTVRDVKNGGRDRFAEFHATKTRSYIDQTIATGQNMFSVLLAGIVLSWWFYHEGRWVEVWSHAGFLTRVSIPLGLNFPGTYPTNSATSSYLAPPRNPTDLEQRRRAWWLCLAFDRIVSVGGWPHSIDERDVGTELPLRRIDFEAENPVASNPQDLHTENMLTRHSPLYTDPFILFIKACMLFGKVTDYNTRMVKLSKNGPTQLTSSVGKMTIHHDPRMAAGFRGLDRLVAVDFLASLPVGFKSCLGVQHGNGGSQGAPVVGDIDGSALDTDLYMVHIIPHAATITLHNPYINFSDPQCPSAARCLDAARAILNAYYLITSTSFDIKRLHPFVTICWYLAAVVLVQACKRLIQTGDRVGEGSIWGEINLMRLAMMEFGSVSPIGVRQEKLLQGLMTDILRMTSQAQPLAVGVPLYPFSRQSLYDPTFQPSITEVVESSNSLTGRGGQPNGSSTDSGGRVSAPIHSAPLPNPSDFDSDPNGTGGPSNPMASLGLPASFLATNVLSAQGIWHPLEELNGDMTGSVGGHGSATMDIFEQFGL